VGSYAYFGPLATFDEFSLKYVSYRIKSSESNSENIKYLSVLLGVKKDTKHYILIDGQISDQAAIYPIKESWDKVRNHTVFGEYVKEFPEPVATEGMNGLDIAALIGKSRTFHGSLSVSKNVVAVLSSVANYNELNQIIFSDWKIDYIDIKTGSVKSHKMRDIDDKNFDLYCNTYYCFVSDGFITIYFSVSSPETNRDITEYKAKINTGENDKDLIKIYTSEEWEKKNTGFDKKLKSDSGRYYTFNKDYDLYLHDNTTGKDKLIYDSFYSDANEMWHKINIASAAFFVGDILYFGITGSAYNIGSGTYNPVTNKLNLYKNGIYVELYSNGYIYGFKCEDYSLYRFNIKSPDKVETLTDSTRYYELAYVFSSDRKYIVEIQKSNPDSDNKNISTVTVYTSSDFKIVKTYTLNSPFSSLQDGVISGDYIYLPVQSSISDNMAYIIKLNDK
jgi:hypothetical protein